MTAQIIPFRRTLTPVDLERAMLATIAAVAAETTTDATGVASRQLVTMACAFSDLAVALGIVPPAVVAELIDR
jgi:hypothetical protein